MHIYAHFLYLYHVPNTYGYEQDSKKAQTHTEINFFDYCCSFGSCLLYDINKLRNVVTGITLSLALASLIFHLAFFKFLPKDKTATVVEEATNDVQKEG